VVENDEFLSLSNEEVIKLISSNDINVSFEEKVRKLRLINVLFNYWVTRLFYLHIKYKLKR